GWAHDARRNISARCWLQGRNALRDQRAILFDLDDTLSPYRGFLRGGFRAVACRLAAERGLPPGAMLRVLRRALANGRRGQALQVLSARFELPESLVGSLADLIREHAPSLRLPRGTAQVLK